jgi:TatD DNase family protein
MAVARAMKKKGMPVRMVTNGEGDLINKRSIARELTGLVDKVSVSLNVDAPDKYDAICKSRFGAGVFEKAKKFALECRDAGMDVEATFLDLPGVDISRCERIARDELGVRFRMRKLEEVG